MLTSLGQELETTNKTSVKWQESSCVVALKTGGFLGQSMLSGWFCSTLYPISAILFRDVSGKSADHHV